MSEVHPYMDWAGSIRNGLAWGIPLAAIVVALFIVVPARTFVWTIALVWMGRLAFSTPDVAGAPTADLPGRIIWQ